MYLAAVVGRRPGAYYDSNHLKIFSNCDAGEVRIAEFGQFACEMEWVGAVTGGRADGVAQRGRSAGHASDRRDPSVGELWWPTYVGWQKVKPLAVDLTAQHAAIITKVAPTHPHLAFQLMWRLVSCADNVFARSDDDSGRLSSVFHDALHELGTLAETASIDPETLVELTFEAVCDNGYGR